MPFHGNKKEFKMALSKKMQKHFDALGAMLTDEAAEGLFIFVNALGGDDDTDDAEDEGEEAEEDGEEEGEEDDGEADGEEDEGEEEVEEDSEEEEEDSVEEDAEDEGEEDDEPAPVKKKVVAKPVAKASKAPAKPVAKAPAAKAAVVAKPVKYTDMDADDLEELAGKLKLDFKPAKKESLKLKHLQEAFAAFATAKKRYGTYELAKLTSIATKKGAEVSFGKGNRTEDTKKDMLIAAIVNASAE